MTCAVSCGAGSSSIGSVTAPLSSGLVPSWMAIPGAIFSADRLLMTPAQCRGPHLAQARRHVWLLAGFRVRRSGGPAATAGRPPSLPVSSALGRFLGEWLATISYTLSRCAGSCPPGLRLAGRAVPTGHVYAGREELQREHLRLAIARLTELVVSPCQGTPRLAVPRSPGAAVFGDTKHPLAAGIERAARGREHRGLRGGLDPCRSAVG